MELNYKNLQHKKIITTDGTSTVGEVIGVRKYSAPCGQFKAIHTFCGQNLNLLPKENL